MLLQDGDIILLPQRIRLHLRHHDGNQAATCGQCGNGTRGNLYPGENSDFLSFQMSDFSLAGNLISWQATAECNKNTYRAHVFLMRILSACLSQPVVTVVQVVAATLSRTYSTHTRGSCTT